MPHGLVMLLLPSRIYSVDTFLYPYALPIHIFPYLSQAFALVAT